MRFAWLLGFCFFVGYSASIATAQVSLFQTERFSNEPQALITVSASPNIVTVVPNSGNGSLFIGQSGTSLLAPFPKRERAVARAPASLDLGRAIRQGTPQLIMLRQLIADAEAGPLDYDAVQYGARIKPGRPPTQMTIGEIYAWIDRTPGQPHAIGRYQFIPPTLRRLVTQLGLSPGTRFSPDVQDQLADILLADAGLAEFTSKQMSRHQFMNNLAKIWAGLPNSTGQSHYHGYAGNKASISWSRFDQEMAAIFAG